MAPPRTSSGPSALVIVLIVVGVLVVLIVGVVLLLRAAFASIGTYEPPVPPPVPDATAEPEPEQTFTPPPPNFGPGAVGDTLTTEHGVSVTLQKVQCGLDGAVGTDIVPDGEFCRIELVLLNESPEGIKVSGADFAIGGPTSEYMTSSEANRIGPQITSARLQPGAQIDVVLYFDVPVGSAIDRVEYQRDLSFDDQLTWTVAPER